MAKKRRKAARRGDAFKRRMARALARHGLTLAQSGRLSDADLLRRKGIGRTMIAMIRAATGPAPPPVPTPAAAVNERRRAARDQRIPTLERQVAELIEAVRQMQELLRVRGIDRRAPLSPEEGREASSNDQIDHPTSDGERNGA